MEGTLAGKEPAVDALPGGDRGATGGGRGRDV